MGKSTGNVESDLRLMIDGMSGIANPKGVQIITDADNNVTLRGSVKDSDEARFVEGLVRITPGVREITNELTATSAAPRCGPRTTTATNRPVRRPRASHHCTRSPATNGLSPS